MKKNVLDNSLRGNRNGEIMSELKLNPFLIQRCKVKTRNKADIKGIDSLFSFDYMGSSEFEFGALSRSLKNLCLRADNLESTKVSFSQKKRKTLWFVSDICNRVAVEMMVRQVADERHRTKEYVGIEAYLNGEEERRNYQSFDAWWDIDHHWVVCCDKELAGLVVESIKKVRDRWKSEGKL